MLESLLKHFRSYGMNDLEFIIVNSKMSHSQMKLEELQKRVSFGVYQETDEEEVWSVMEGGKDDMFIYDRCGRLTYFVPFPLSILNEYPLVSNAVLATYFRSPCGITCEQNGTVEIGDIAKNIVLYEENETAVTQDEALNITNETTFASNITANESSNDILFFVDSENNSTDLNSTDFVTLADYDYLYSNETINKNETNSTIFDDSRSYMNNLDILYRLFINADKKSEEKFERNKSEENFERNILFYEADKNETMLQMENSALENNTLHMQFHHHHEVETSSAKPKKKSERCVEADYAVCKSWSKKRLLHAQKCCSLLQSEADEETLRSCHHFGKRRCKKIQSILKCCIKTGLTETAVTTPDPSMTMVPTTEASNIVYVVCCRFEDSTKFCRVSETGACREDELVEDSLNKSKCQELP